MSVGFSPSFPLAGFTIALLLLLSTVYNVNTSSASGGSSDKELLSYEPLQYLKTVLPSVDGDSVWREFVELSAEEAGDLTAEMKKKLKYHLAKSGTSVVFAKGERVLTQRRSSNLKWDSRIELPYSNTLSLLSVTLPILLEGYKHSVIGDPIGKVLKGEHLKNPLVRGRDSKSFLDLLNKLPKSGPALDLDSNALVEELEANGELAVYLANTVLGQSAKEAWMDALMAIGMEEMKFSQNGRLVVNLKVLLQFTLTVLHDFKLLGVVPKSEIFPPDGDRYLFGWWQNCPKTESETTKCFFPNLPEDTVFSLSPDVRIYISPSVELLLIVLGPDVSPDTKGGDFTAKKELKSIGDIIQADGMIWERLRSVIYTEDSNGATTGSSSSDADAFPQSDASEREGEEDKRQKRDASEQSPPSSANEGPVEDPDQSILTKWIHWLWPIFVFLFWVTISHVWVYWLLHCLWFILTRISKRAHIPRPKTAADAGQN